MTATTTLTKISLRVSNAYLIAGEHPILVDAGCPGEEDRIGSALARKGVQVEDLRLLVHTHGHVDHCGSTKALRDLSHAPVLLHQAEVYKMEGGIFGDIPATRPFAWVVHQFVPKHYPGLTPDIVLHSGTDLRRWGCAGQILCTPGHTSGSISVLLDTGDAIVGDLLMGGYLAGALLPGAPDFAYFNEDLSAVLGSLTALLGAGAERFHVGHGGPLARDRVARFVQQHSPKHAPPLIRPSTP